MYSLHWLLLSKDAEDFFYGFVLFHIGRKRNSLEKCGEIPILCTGIRENTDFKNTQNTTLGFSP